MIFSVLPLQNERDGWNEQRESLRNQATEYKSSAQANYVEIDGSREFTESEIQAWGLYLGQVGHRYEAEAV